MKSIRPMETATRRVMPRFSLFSFTLAVTIAVLAFGLWAARRENVRLDAENQRLASDNAEYRDELGIFEIEEETKIHAIGVETLNAPDTHRIRVYVPPGRQFEMRIAVHDIPKEGLPTSPQQTAAMEIGSGVSLVTCMLIPAYDPATGARLPFATIDIQIDGPKSPGYLDSIAEVKNDWILNKETRQFAYRFDSVGLNAKVHDADRPVELLRVRAAEIVVRGRHPDGMVKSWSAKEIADPCDGFMLWIQPKSSVAGASP
jgi:hypothetical protein